MRYKEDQLMYGSFLVGHPVKTPEFDSRQQSVPSHVCIPGVLHVRGQLNSYYVCMPN